MSFKDQLNNFADSLLRIVNSAKIKTAAGLTVSAYFVARNVAPTVPLEQRIYLWVPVFVAGITTFSFAIHGWTMEDVADATPPPAAATPPTQQVVTGDHAQVNSAAPASSAPATTAAPAVQGTLKLPDSP